MGSFSHTRAAEAHRADKAQALALQLYELGYTGREPLETIERKERRRIERLAEVRRSSDLTWRAALDVLTRRRWRGDR